MTSRLALSAKCWAVAAPDSRSVFKLVSFGRRDFADCSRDSEKAVAVTGSLRRADRKRSLGGEGGGGTERGTDGSPMGRFNDKVIGL